MRKSALWIMCLVLAGLASSAAPVRVGDLRCEPLEDPIGIGVRQPRLSWKLVSGNPGKRQTAYQIRAGEAANGKREVCRRRFARQAPRDEKCRP